MLWIVDSRLQALDRLWDLPCEGLPGELPSGILAELFWSSVVTCGHIYRRLVRPYRKPPLCLARMCDNELSVDFKMKLAEWVVNLPDCCCCSLFMKPLRENLISANDLVFGEGRRVLEAAFMGTNTNVQVENCFARAASMQRVTRGRSNQTPSLFAKHYLAEIKKVHTRTMNLRSQESQECHQKSFIVGAIQSDEMATESQEDASIPGEGQVDTSGYLLLCMMTTLP